MTRWEFFVKAGPEFAVTLLYKIFGSMCQICSFKTGDGRCKEKDCLQGMKNWVNEEKEK